MSNPADIENDERLNLLTPDDDAAPISPGRRSEEVQSIEPDSFDDIPDHDDSPEVMDELEGYERETRRSGLPQVRWAEDAEQPDYAHLIGAEDDGIVPDGVITLTPEILDLLVKANSFHPEKSDGKFLFALRGGKLRKHRYVENVDAVEIEITRPDHKNFRCTIGWYDVANRKLTAYLSSTVPNQSYMQNYYKKKNKIRPYRNINANILPTGCYVYRKNAHGGGKINPAMRMTEPSSVNSDARATVLRTSNNLTFEYKDFWDLTTPYDNIHCAYYTTKFSSAGCQTILGANRKSAWGRFQKELDLHKWDTRFGYVLLTGREAAIAAKILAMPQARREVLINRHLRRLRVGSFGPEVSALQIKMGYTGKTQYFGPSTRKKLVEYEGQKKLKTDSIYSWQDDQAFGWNVFKPLIQSDASEEVSPAPTLPPQNEQSAVGNLAPQSVAFTAGPEGGLILEDGKKLILPQQGAWSVRDGGGELQFQPEIGFSGKVHPVTYQISKPTGAMATASIAINISEANKATIVSGDAVRNIDSQAMSIVVLVNHADNEGQPDRTSIVLVRGPQGSQFTASGKKMIVPNVGTWTVDPLSGEIDLDPFVGFSGVSGIEYEIADSTGAKKRAHVVATVRPIVKTAIAANDNLQAAQSIKQIIVNIQTVKNRSLQSPVAEEADTAPVAQQAPASTVMPGPIPNASDELQFEGAVKFTEAQIRRFLPKAKEKYIRALVEEGPRLLAQHGITATPMRFCHFMGQISHESGGFTIDSESMYYTTAARIRAVWPSRFKNASAAQPYVRNEKKLAEKVYGGRMRDLGNSQRGDGYKYRGRGLIQITGRANYRDMGRKIGVDLEGDPDLAFEGSTALLIAAQTWSDRTRSGRTMNQLADENKIDIITLRINGGYTNIGHRKSEFERAWKIWGTGQPPRATKSDAIERGDRGKQVRTLQELLVQKGYFPADETIDGIFGGKTMKAVARFQHTHNQTAPGADRLNVNGIVDKKTLAALRAANDVRRGVSKIARNARDPRSLEKRGRVRRSFAAQELAPETPRWRSIAQLLAVLLILMVLALTTVSLSEGVTQDKKWWDRLWPHYLVLVGMIVSSILLFTMSIVQPKRHRSRVDKVYADDDPVHRLADRDELELGPLSALEAAPMEADTASWPDDEVLGLDAPLHNYNLSEADFEDREPIRSAPALSDEVDIETGDIQQEEREAGYVAPALEPEDGLEEPGAPDKRNAFTGERGIGVAPFEVSNRNVRLVLIKMFGGDNNLSHQVDNDLDEIVDGIRGGHGDIAIIALADQANAPGSIIEVTPQGERKIIAALDEIDTGDPETLANFVARALVTYPQARKAIGFWDHGTGAFDEFDPDEVLLTRSWNKRGANRSRPARRLLVPESLREQLQDNPSTRGMLHDSTGGILTNIEAGRMLRAAFYRAGNKDPLDMIYSDTCLNGMVEVLTELSDYAHCIVASSDTEPGEGWDYERWISAKNADFPATPEAWGKSAVQAFNDRYQNDVSQYPCTLAAFSTQNDIVEAFADLVDIAEAEASSLKIWLMLTHARSITQGYDNRDAYDLIDFAQKLKLIAAQNSEPQIQRAAERLDVACRMARLDFIAYGPTVIESQGLAFWFPSSKHSLNKDIQTYCNLKFALSTGWADYLEANYLAG